MSDILNITQLAERLGWTRQTIHHKLKNNTFPVRPIEGLKPFKWFAEDVENWLKSEKSKG